MATETKLDYIGSGTSPQTHAHLRPLDTVITALEETRCTWCAGLLRLLKQHLESDIPALGSEVLN
jgi:hypothetical protein